MSDILPAKNEKGETLLEWDDSWRGAYEARSGKVQEVGKMTPDFLGSLSTTLSWKNLSLHIATDMRFGGLVASYSNLYGTQAGWIKSSLKWRDPEHGGCLGPASTVTVKGSLMAMVLSPTEYLRMVRSQHL